MCIRDSSTSCANINDPRVFGQTGIFTLRIINLEELTLLSLPNPYSGQAAQCVEILGSRSNIVINGSNVVRRGLVYQYQIILDQPADGLKIFLAPTGNSAFITLNPNVLSVDSFKQTTFTIQLGFGESITAGTLSVRFQKQELLSTSQPLFNEILPLLVTVIADYEKGYLVEQATVTVESIGEEIVKGGSGRNMTIRLNYAPADNLIVRVALKSGSNTGVSLVPSSIYFANGELSKVFTIFSNDSAFNDILTFSLDGYNQNAYKLLTTELPITFRARKTNSSAQVLGIQPISIMENSLSLLLGLSDSCKVFYMLTYTASPCGFNPNVSQIIQQTFKNGTNTRYWYGTASSKWNSSSYQDSALIGFDGLLPGWNFTIFFVTQTEDGSYSQEPKSYNFSTKQATPGVIFSIKLSKAELSSSVIDSLSKSLQVSAARFVLFYDPSGDLFSYRKLNDSKYKQAVASPQLIFRFYLLPDTYNNTPPSSFYINQYANNGEVRRKLKALLPTIDLSYPLDYYELRANIPYPIILPKIVSLYYYNVVVTLTLSEKGRVFAALIPSPHSCNFTSYQIYSGLWPDNNDIDPRKHFKGETSDNGTVTITFDELIDNRTYAIYFVAGNYLPYDPPNLAENKDVFSINFTTPFNPNVEGTPDPDWQAPPLSWDSPASSSYLKITSMIALLAFIIQLINS
eukprot:TRINITY_DN3023_c0_g3_i1.p1 TRINITY_DN3023_c0_g3~~TRINITY_DN3023_c0_g3_i1.p1  ORF type:complete len:686 (+),score=72.20 TRINITY_DN3023_c0_g3_i1:3-2060(+)